MNNNSVTIALLQQTRSKSMKQNFEATVQEIKKSAKKGAQIICLQELFRSQYFCQSENTKYFKLSESIPGQTTTILSALAKELEIVIIAPLFEKRTEGIYHNTAVIIDADGTIVDTYRKMHIPDDPYFFEKFYFTPGDKGFKSFPTRFGRVGILICWDQWFPEAARLVSLSGAQIIFYPTAIGYHDSDYLEVNRQISAWETIQKSHAIANGVFVASINRVGKEDNLTFWGKSFVCDPFGEKLAQAKQTSSENLIVKCDLLKIEDTRQSWPFLRDRRVDAYQSLDQIYHGPNS
jgi:N-carbamoylputrescine amidase